MENIAKQTVNLFGAGTNQQKEQNSACRNLDSNAALLPGVCLQSNCSGKASFLPTGTASHCTWHTYLPKDPQHSHRDRAGIGHE